jgi:glyoxylase-like metal-dependent hydrolase (beta-lactamase superfamily II)
MNIEPLTDCISLIHGRDEGVFPYSHSILIQDKEVVLIDTGCGIENLSKLRQEYQIDYVINSHTHPDHSAGNWVLEGMPIHVPEERFEASGDAAALGERFVGRENAGVFQEFVKQSMGFRNCRPTHAYNRQTVFDFGKTRLLPIHTPGHTVDHYCFFEPEKRILFSFDYDLTPFPWYGHVESILTEFRESVGKLKDLSPDVVISSHRGIIIDDIDEEFDRYCERIDRRDDKLLSLLTSEKTVAQLVECAPIYGSYPYAEPLLRYWERQMIEEHLDKLVVEGRVEIRGKSYIRV